MVSYFLEIKEYNLTPDTKFIIIASDGIWDHLSNETVSNIINKYYLLNDIDSGIQILINEVTEVISKKEDRNIDDITIIIIFFS